MAESPLSPLLIDLAPTNVENSSVTVSEPALIPVNQLAIDVELPNSNAAQLPIKLPDLITSNSESEMDEAQQTSSSSQPNMAGSNTTTTTATTTNTAGSTTTAESERAVSPPPNCAICLGRCRKKCFTDSCMHQFCFKCLCEWSKVKPECPLCKQTFKSIIHNVKSMHQFEEYHVQPPTVQIHNAEASANILYGDMQFRLNEADVGNRVPMRPRIVYPTFISSLGDPALQRSNVPVHPYLANLQGHTGTENLHMDTFSWRCVIYTAKLYALPVSDIGGRYRESSARFYRDNPAQIHRLIPFINRDVAVLLRNSSTSVTRVVDSINTSLPLLNISSPAFRRRIHQYLGENTSHFIHELNNFARSPYDMIGYDRVVHYMPRTYHRSQAVEFSSTSSVSSGDDNRAAQQIPGELAENAVPAAEAADNRAANDYAAFSVSNTAEGAEVSGISMVGQSAAINLSTHNRAADAQAAPVVEPVEVIELDDEPEPIVDPTVHELTDDEAPAHAEPTITDNIDLAESTSSDCEFVLARKPPHLRTPEMVSLNSESDSDVVFVAEEKPQLPVENKTPEENSIQKEAKSSNTPRTRQTGYDGLFMGASTSTGITTAQRKRLTRKSMRKRFSASKRAAVTGSAETLKKRTRSSVAVAEHSSSDSGEELVKKRNNKPNKTKAKNVQTTTTTTNETPTTRGRLKRRQTRSDRDSSTTLKKKSKTAEVESPVSSDIEYCNLKELKDRLETLKKQYSEMTATAEGAQEQTQTQTLEETETQQESVTAAEGATETKNLYEQLINSTFGVKEVQENQMAENNEADERGGEAAFTSIDIKFEIETNKQEDKVAEEEESSSSANSESSNSGSTVTGSTPVLSRTPSGKGYSSSTSTETDSSESYKSELSLPKGKEAEVIEEEEEGAEQKTGYSSSSSASSSVRSMERITRNWEASLDRAEHALETAMALQLESDQIERELSEAGAIIINPARVRMQIRNDDNEGGVSNGGSYQNDHENIDVEGEGEGEGEGEREGDESFISNGFEDYEQHNVSPSGE